MKSVDLRLLALCTLSLTGACADTGAGPSGPEVAIEVAPLTLPGVVGIEWSGVATASATDVAAAGGNVTATTFGNVGQTTTNANDVLVIAINYNTVSGANTATDNNVGGIWTANSAASISSMVAKSDYAVVSATGTYSNTWTVGTTQTSGWAFVSLKAASVAINSVSAITKVFGLG